LPESAPSRFHPRYYINNYYLIPQLRWFSKKETGSHVSIATQIYESYPEHALMKNQDPPKMRPLNEFISTRMLSVFLKFNEEAFKISQFGRYC
jgi:hypothetical protein